MDYQTSTVAFALTAVLGGAGLAIAGPVFDEPPGGDAGSTKETATDVKTDSGQGNVGMITGSLTGSTGLVGGFGDFQDVYRIYIADPLHFQAATMPLDGDAALRDPMLYLFNEAGQGIMANNDVDQGESRSKLVNSDGNGGQFFTNPGIYYLAITSAMSEATGMLGDEIVPLFEMGLPEHQVGLVQPRESWSQISWTDWTPPNDLENYGYYEVALTGVVSLPAPGGLALLGLALIGPRRRRR